MTLNKKCSIVFSGWKKSLDLTATILDQEDIRFARIDGSVTNISRLQALETFKIDPDLNVLLMTIGTGAVG